MSEIALPAALALISVISGQQQSNAAGKRAKRAREDNEKQNALDLKATNKRAADQLKIDQATALRQQQATLANLQLSAQQSNAQVDAQLRQQLLTREQLLGQQFLVEEQGVREQSARDDKFFQTALQQSIKQERNKKLRRRDTILTSPIAPANTPSNGVAIDF